MLSLCQFRASFRRLTGMLQIAARVAAITFLELRDCLRWSHRRLIRVSGISCSGKLGNPNQTNEGETGREICFFHVPFMKEGDCSINSKVRRSVQPKNDGFAAVMSSLRDSLSFVNHQPIPVRIAKCRPMANLRFGRSEEEDDAVFAQVFESGFKVFDFKCD